MDFFDDESKSIVSHLTRKYGLTKRALSKLLEMDVENEDLVLQDLEFLQSLTDPSAFFRIFMEKADILTPVSRQKASEHVHKALQYEKMKESGLVFAKVLRPNELGIRSGGGRAGSFVLIPKLIARDYFGELSTVTLNPKKIFNVSVHGSVGVYDFIYDYHNSKVVSGDKDGRNEYRMYSTYFSELNPEDIILMMPVLSPTIDYVAYRVSPTASYYSELVRLINDYKVGRSLSALIPVLGLISIGMNFPGFFDIEKVDSSDPLEEEALESKEEKVFVPSALSEAELSKLLRESLENEGIERSVTLMKKIKRDRRFRKAVLSAYNFKCAVTGQSIQHEDIINVQAAHIKGKEYGGSDNPTNGISLSLDLHWAFDKGFFTIEDDFTVLVHEKLADNKTLQTINRKKIYLPENESFYPNRSMLKFHRENVFGKFNR